MDESRKDPDWIAYITDLGRGELDHLREKYVAYRDEKLLTFASTQSDLLKKVREEFPHPTKQTLIQKVDAAETMPMPTFKVYPQ